MIKYEKKNHKRVIIGAVIFLSIAVVSVGFIRINKKYPRAVTETVGINQKIEMDGLNFEVKKAHFYTTEELKNLNGFPKEIMYTPDMRLITLDVEVKNVSGEGKKFEAAYNRIETIGWSGGVDINMFAFFNQEKETIVLELDHDETASYTLTYPIIPLGFQKKDWSKIEEKEYLYVLSLYPIKRSIMLQFS